MEFNKNEYKEKKNQAPSYTDRILFKNNSNLKFCDDYYKCLHNVYGSDHRPVVRGLTLKGFGNPKFADVQRLVDMEKPEQGLGRFDIEMVNVMSLNLERITQSTKFDFNEMVKPL